MPGKFEGCIAEALAHPEGDAEEKAQLRQAQATYDEAFAHAAATLSPEAADREAARVVMDELAAAKARAGQLRAMSIRTRRDVLAGIAAYKRGRGYQNVQDLG